MFNAISNTISTMATEASAHPLVVAGGITVVGGLTVVACKASMKIQRFVLGVFAGMFMASLFVASQLGNVSPFITGYLNIPVIALTILGGGFLGGWHSL